MKKSINLLCVLIICVVGVSVVMPTYNIGYYFGTGFRAGWESEQNGTAEDLIISNRTTVSTVFTPNVNKMIYNPDTIVSENSNESVPVVWSQGTIFVPDQNIPLWFIIITTVCQLAVIVCVIILIIKFIKLIVNINKDIIFEIKNVRLLRQIGLSFLLSSLFQFLSGITSELFVDTIPYSFAGYDLSALWVLPWSNVLFGLIAYLMAQIWARGIQMREEQELTI